jgi:hypothetical protein
MFPFWGVPRVLFSLGYTDIPAVYRKNWEYFLNIVEYPLLLGFVPPKIQEFFFQPQTNKNPGQYPSLIRMWKPLKTIYLFRRNSYKNMLRSDESV